jgi:hypothetical protein
VPESDLEHPLEQQTVEKAAEATARPKTKPSVPINKLIPEMRRRARSGEIKQGWQTEAKALSAWCDTNYPDEPHSFKGQAASRVGERMGSREYERMPPVRDAASGVDGRDRGAPARRGAEPHFRSAGM